MRISLSKSSSFALAVLFTVVLLFSVATLVYFMHLLGEYFPHNPLVYPLGFTTIGLLIVASAAGFFVGDRVVYRINLIADTSQNIIQTGDLSRRIPVLGNWDDLSKLTGILNTLFDRIELLMENVRRVSDHVAHDLRTPLTRLRNQLEMLHDRGEEEQLGITDATEKLLFEADNILATFSALLRIGNIESGKWKVERETVHLGALITDVVEFYEPLANDRTQHITTELASLSLLGDKHLLFQALANLLDNAIKYAAEGSDIRVSLRHNAGDAVITMKNTGSFVPTEHISNLFERYYRADTARASGAGNGLGLSLVKAVVELHRGSIAASSDANSFTITCRLPCSAASGLS
jgi:signal transduction histidine kinase